MRLLLVEDHPDVAEMTLEVLTERMSVDASWAANGSRAIEVAGTLRPDMFLIDLRLPDMSGFELARRLRTECGFDKTPMIALSGFSDLEERKAALAAGFDAFYTKPMDLSLLETVHGLKSSR